MAENWLDDVRKYDSSADESIVSGIVRYCGISLRNRDSALVSFSDATETGRVRDNFLRKKLALTGSDEELNQGLEAVKSQLTGDATKNRVTVYYLLAKYFDKLDLFAGKAGGAATTAAAGAAGAAGATGASSADAVPAAATQEAEPPPAQMIPEEPAPSGGKRAAAIGAAGLASATAAAAAADRANEAAAGDAVTPLPASRDDPKTAAGTDTPRDRGVDRIADVNDRGGTGWPSWLTWLLIGAALIGVVLLLRGCGSNNTNLATTDTTNTMAVAPDNNLAAPVTDVAEAPAPVGAGVVSSTVEGKPLTRVYFDTAKSDVSKDFVAAAATLKTYLAANPGTKLAVSDYNDPTGNAAANSALSKSRAEHVAAALATAGIAKESVELIKPAETTITNVTRDQARRVEITVK